MTIEMTPEAPPEASPPPPDPPPSKSERWRIVVGVVILAVVVTTYALSLFGVHTLQKTEAPLPPLDLSAAGPDDTVVQIRLEELKTVANRLTVNVLVYPGDSLIDKRFDVLTTEIAVRLYPRSDVGDLKFPAGQTPSQITTTIEAHGDPGNWPFDTYHTEKISADVLVGSGDHRKRLPARVEVTGSMDGWEVDVNRTHASGGPLAAGGANNGDVQIMLERAKGPLIFDLGICLVLVSLPTLALLVAVPMAMGRRKFLPPFATWYAANLFAIVPLRNILPGSPPPGSWIDQAIVQWVLIALVVAMSLYIFAWVRQGD